MRPSPLSAWLLLAIAASFPAAAQQGVPPASGGAPAFSLSASKDRQTFQDHMTELQDLGYRFSQDAILSPDTKKPITEAQAQDLLAKLQRDQRKRALDALERLTQGGAMGAAPQALTRMLGPDQSRQFQDAARSGDPAALKRFFENARDESAARGAAAVSVAAKSVGYFDSTEAKLGAMLQETVDSDLRRYPSSADLMDRLKAADPGEPVPRMLVLRADSREAAHYDSGSKSVVLNQTALVESIVAQAAAEHQDISGQQELIAYLANHPEAVRKFVADHDGTIAHELTHAWQDRREKIASPDIDPIEDEHEAFERELLLCQDKLAATKSTKACGSDYEDYASLLADKDRYLDSITQEYLSKFPETAARFSDVATLMHERGDRQGEAAARQWLAAANEQLQAFDAGYPRMRVQGLLALAQAEAGPDGGGFGRAFLMTEQARAALAALPPGAEAPGMSAQVEQAEKDFAGKAYDWASRGSGIPKDLVDTLTALEEYWKRVGQARPATFQKAKMWAECIRAKDVLGDENASKEAKRQASLASFQCESGF